MPRDRIAIGLVGAGRIARLIHLPVLADLAGVRLAAVAEPDDGARAAAAAIVPGARSFRDLDEMLDREAVDGVVICAPPATHCSLAARAFATGRAVYLEKPIALTLSDAHTVIEAQQAAGTIGMTGFMLRFSRPFIEARTLIASGAIGEVVAAHSVFTSPPVDGPQWRHRQSCGGGALLDLLSHHADVVRWLLATEVVSVGAKLQSVLSEDDTAAVAMSTESGVCVQTLVCTSAAEDHRFEVVGTEGRLAIDPWRMASPERVGLSGPGGRIARLRLLAPSRLLHRPDYRGPFRGALSAFASATHLGRPCAPDLTDGLASLAVIEAAQRSARSGAIEAVPELPLAGHGITRPS